jgi:hypothetical protein
MNAITGKVAMNSDASGRGEMCRDQQRRRVGDLFEDTLATRAGGGRIFAES